MLLGNVILQDNGFCIILWVSIEEAKGRLYIIGLWLEEVVVIKSLF
jgi:hypothetical protein